MVMELSLHTQPKAPPFHAPVFLAKRQLVKNTEPWAHSITPQYLCDVLFVIVQWLIVTDESVPQNTPPLDIPAELPVMEQLDRVSKELNEQCNPPPNPSTHIVTPVAELSLMIQSVKVVEDSE